ncbi:uncharacterized protein LOC141613053 [Silene latifolia]|uniref:uncharacterized protein LOC141613053 n=1 Tax=Silene latifolia TaxID=37657 RepID=UPI003D78AE2F
MEMLSRLLRTMCATQDVFYHPKCVKLGLTHLIFADDLMVFTRGDLPSVQKVAEILKSLNANFEKSEAYFGGVNSVLKQHILNAIGLKKESFHFRYLGLPIHPSRLTSTMYDPIVQKIQHLVRSCAVKFLSYASKIEVLNSMVFGLENFWCGRLLLPHNVCIIITKLCKQLFWGYQEGQRKLVFKSWASICSPWSEGGFQIKNLAIWN